jgi:hypothetical protein
VAVGSSLENMNDMNGLKPGEIKGRRPGLLYELHIPNQRPLEVCAGGESRH